MLRRDASLRSKTCSLPSAHTLALPISPAIQDLLDSWPFLGMSNNVTQFPSMDEKLSLDWAKLHVSRCVDALERRAADVDVAPSTFHDLEDIASLGAFGTRSMILLSCSSPT
jgi:hypothetical protein